MMRMTTEQAWDREASDGLFPEPTLPPECSRAGSADVVTHPSASGPDPRECECPGQESGLTQWVFQGAVKEGHDEQDESSRVQKVNLSAITPVPRDTEISSLVLAAAESSEELVPAASQHIQDDCTTACFPIHSMKMTRLD
ncbi:hypothetical protein BTVI_61202 [Pitangus sulphuratus]|nr:hypothetical protein BTVI_61202 [Pitangus sulphuratus]